MLRTEDQVIQRYIDRPLIIDGKKHDLRLYMLIASVDPLIVFLNEEGLARFCSEDYTHPNNANSEKNSHLTNYSLNKNSENFVITNDLTEINNGSKRTLTSYWKSVAKAGYDVDEVNTIILY